MTTYIIIFLIGLQVGQWILISFLTKNFDFVLVQDE
jgi:hypothetical protein